MSGRSMLAAGMVADSSPRNAQSVSAAAAGTLVASVRTLASAISKCDASKCVSPSAATSASGNSFRTVVTTCTHPAARAPITLTATRLHTATRAAPAAVAGVAAICGTSAAR